MPSSHGGGGSHGGSSFSHSSSGSHSTNQGISSRPYPGSRRYVYVDRYGRDRFFYSSTLPEKRTLIASLIPALLFLLVPIIMIIIVISDAIPIKLANNKCNFTQTYIEDNADIIDDSSLQPLLEAFYEKSGVQPYIYTISKYSLVNDGFPFSTGGLEDKAYDEYIKTFNDEGHWMIALVVENSDDWYWCDMAGDDTNKVVTDKLFSIFQETMEESKNNHETYTYCLIDSFDVANSIVLSSKSIDFVSIILPCAFLLIFIGIGVIALVGTIKSHNQLKDFFAYEETHRGTTLNGEDINTTNINNSSTNSNNDFTFNDDDFKF